MSTTNEATTAAPIAQELVKEKDRAELRPLARDTDFKEKYPPDRELGKELGDTARVWKVYRGEAIDYDDALLKTWNETVNILLTFAGLFSAAVTSFVLASTDNLKPDPNAYVANLLFALGNATAASVFAHLPAPPPVEAAPTSLARVVNGFWYTSLFLSLAAALLCILVKQWLDEYTSRTRGSAKHPHEWAQRRSFYFRGLDDWNVAAIISFLPLFLHLALFLFLAGLTAFLWDLDRDIRWVMLALVLLLIAFYAVSLFLPVWSAACPYATPLLAQLSNLGYIALIGVCILRKWALSCRAAISPVIRRLLCRRYPASLSTSSDNTDTESSEGGAPTPDFKPSEGGAPTPDKQIQLLLEHRSRRPFQRELHRITKMEHDLPEPKRGGFAAGLDCSVLSWLIHDVSDSDAVAVAWQSLGALIEEPESPRYTCMSAVLKNSKFVDELGGITKLWGTLRMDGILDDMHLGRITRSALFLAASLKFQLDLILPYVHSSDVGWSEGTLSPDAVLIYAHSVPAERAIPAMHRLHEKGFYRPLPSTAMFILHRLLSNHGSFAPEAVIRSLSYCELRAITKAAWNCVAGVLGADHSHICNAYCIVNRLAERAIDSEDEVSNSSGPSQVAVTPFDAYSLVQLITRILSVFSGCDTELSAAVWTVLTHTRYFQRRVQREDRIRADNWAKSLFCLAESSNRFYASFATQYNSTWCMLLRGFLRNHPNIVLDEGIDFNGGPGIALQMLAHSLVHVAPGEIEATDLALRPARLRSALALLEIASMSLCSADRNWVVWNSLVAYIPGRLPLVSFLPNNLALTEEEHNNWVDLFVSAVQHLMVLDPLPWDDFREAVTTSVDNDVKTFYSEVLARLVKVGPCTKGACAGHGPADWLAALGSLP